MKKNPLKAYQKTQVTTAKKENILLMLYEGCIRYMKVSKVCIHELNEVKEGRLEDSKGKPYPEMRVNTAKKGKFISKSMDIVSELMNTLDHEQGGQISSDLESLYMFVIDRLIEANVHNKEEEIDVCVDLMSNLYVAWADVINNPRPDGMPSKELQPELYEQWQASQAK